ncbi:MAG TPA: TlpA disulfide reductase family protein [Gemmatimonadaceae bacterium]|nr:TlpA disulfide reductase family protein [Gemmatimonadaceae bacterium]
MDLKSGRRTRLLVAAGLAAVLGTTALRGQESGIPVGSAAPVAKLETLDGKPADLGAFIGKGPVLIEFWATWCENCKALEPALLAAQKKYAGRVQFVGIAVSANQSPELVRRYVERHRLAGTQLYDKKGASIDAYDVPATSFVVVISRAGKVVYTGLGGGQDLDSAIKKAF